ncbi:MAG TPA: family 1 glycosylhydrolase [Caulobacteraceae bacterium]|jgi:dTDP-4-dehydrorhamnose reductase
MRAEEDFVVTALELWGGCECTVNRVGDRYFDQTVRTGRDTRRGDLARFADLGIKAFRLPLLWERISPDRPDAHDFAWSDGQLDELKRLGMRPIAGLVHHGSGPHYTSLVDERFAPGLAAHARAVAQRYPWIDAWTPVNEPLTTARFSCLYGHWYPHAHDDRSWIEALLNQIDATRLAMAEIRRVNPGAKLVQTEDLGFVHSTWTLKDQARFENERRWLTWDLLEGRVDADHPMYAWLAGHGFADRLKAIADDPCPPDVIGVNHYLTSERFLDERIGRYRGIEPGGNGRERYVDIEAVRVVREGPLGLGALLGQAWMRYARPLAVTEAHNGCTRDEQMRWFHQAWRDCERLRGEGVEVQAVTAWSLLGAYDWTSLLTRDGDDYECGVFDLRGGEPRPTAMASLLRTLAKGEDPREHDIALASPGWWRRPSVRYRFEPVSATHPHGVAPDGGVEAHDSAPLLIAGRGPLARAFARHCRFRGLAYATLDLRALVDADALDRAIDRHQPVALIDAGDHASAPDCAAARGLRVLSVAAHAPGRLHTPVEAGFCHDDEHGFVARVLDALAEERPFTVCDDHRVAPVYRPDLVDAALDLLIDGASGRWRLAGPEQLTWAGFARMLAEAAGHDPALVRAAPKGAFQAAPRQTDDWDGHIPLPPLESALTRLLAERAAARERAQPGLLYAAE